LTRTFTSTTSGRVTLRIPANMNVAIRQWYMLYALNIKTHSVARWVQVV
jgi:hypothetical protein